MTRVYLFDWGDTLMVDIPGQAGKMCDWPEVKPVAGAAEALAHISQSSKIYVATNAAESAPKDIQRAFERASLSQFVSGYFCRANLGIAKGTAGVTLLHAAAVDPRLAGLAMPRPIFQAVWYLLPKNPRRASRKGV